MLANPEMGHIPESEMNKEHFKTVFQQALERMRDTSYTVPEAEQQKDQLERLGN